MLLTRVLVASSIISSCMRRTVGAGRENLTDAHRCCHRMCHCSEILDFLIKADDGIGWMRVSVLAVELVRAVSSLKW